MRAILAAGAAAALLIVAARAKGGADSAVPPAPPERPADAPLEWSEFARAFAGPAPRPAGRAAEEGQQVASPEPDVVDAHWMALTMWGEARGDGEEGMRAVGHVIDNRRRQGDGGTAFVTDTVSEAFQFSCWNPGDPNLEAIQHVDSLPRASREQRMWLAARRIADEILSGRSDDPTGGALFYHAVDVAPEWSEGIPPVRRVGRHLFFRGARGS